MAWKLSVFALCVCVIAHINAIEHKEEEGPVHYEFSYSVHDPHTGDIKSQKESRKDDKVVGQYELIEPDGHRRIVQYKADDHNGFEAIVHREPTDIKIPQPERQHKHEHEHETAKVVRAVPLVHYGHAERPHYETHVLFSGPHSQYKY